VRGRGIRATAIALLALGQALAAPPAGADTLRLGYESWVAPGPFFIARDKGWFEEEGVSVELVDIEDIGVRASALASGDVDAITANIDEAVLHLAASSDPRFLFAIAESHGGDGIIADKGIERIANLRGHTVAVQPATSREFYLDALLRDAGLSEADVAIVAKAPGEAGLAFERRQVDAAVTWQPWLSRTALMPHGHVLTDSSQQPGLLVEAVVARREVLEKREADFQALYRAWLRAVEWAKKNPDDSAALIADGVGRWLRDKLVVAEMREGIAYYDDAMNQAYFGDATAPGPIVDTVGSAMAIWSKNGGAENGNGPADMVSRAVVGGK
jgi:NitT/TauT family transport system substrate-binding protein